MEQDEAAYPCKGCGEVRDTPPCCLSAKPLPGLDPSANDCNLYIDTRGRKGFRTWWVSTIRWLHYEIEILMIYQRAIDGT